MSDEGSHKQHNSPLRLDDNYYVTIRSSLKRGVHLFFKGATAPSGPGPPHCRSFTITLRHTKFSRNSLDGCSARSRRL